jgi:hypothetical protein
MAVVTRYTNGYPAPTPAAGTGYGVVSAHESRAIVKAAFFSIAVTSGDSINSVYRLARLPSNAIILPQSNVYVTAAGIAGLTSVSIGFDNLLGTVAAAALASAVDMHAGGAFPLTPAVTIAHYNQRVWEQLGLASDPGAQIDLIATLGASPGASGVMAGHVLYTIAGI